MHHRKRRHPEVETQPGNGPEFEDAPGPGVVVEDGEEEGGKGVDASQGELDLVSLRGEELGGEEVGFDPVRREEKR